MLSALEQYLARFAPQLLKKAAMYGAPAVAMGRQIGTKGVETIKNDPLTAAALAGSGGILGFELGSLEDEANPGKPAVSRDDMREIIRMLQGEKGTPFRRKPGRPPFKRDAEGNIIRE